MTIVDLFSLKKRRLKTCLEFYFFLTNFRQSSVHPNFQAFQLKFWLFTALVVPLKSRRIVIYKVFTFKAVPELTTQGNPSVATDLPPVLPRQFLRWPPVGIGGHRWAIGGDRCATDGLRWATGGPSKKGPQRLVTLVETAGKFYKHRHACTDNFR